MAKRTLQQLEDEGYLVLTDVYETIDFRRYSVAEGFKIVVEGLKRDLNYATSGCNDGAVWVDVRSKNVVGDEKEVTVYRLVEEKLT